MPMLFYTPSAEQLQTQSRSNNQGRSGQAVEASQYAEALQRWTDLRQAAAGAYEWMTNVQIARELARIDLPLSTYTQWYWKIDLHNLLHFLTLRADAHAQWEIQEYGRVMAGMLKRVAPLSFEAWLDYDVEGASFSRLELAALRQLLRVQDGGLAAAGGIDAVALEKLGLSKREVSELLTKLEPRQTLDFELDLSQAKSAEYFAERFASAVPAADRTPPESP
jgi:thymidylate synthase (FAD)